MDMGAFGHEHVEMVSINLIIAMDMYGFIMDTYIADTHNDHISIFDNIGVATYVTEF